MSAQPTVNKSRFEPGVVFLAVQKDAATPNFRFTERGLTSLKPGQVSDAPVMAYVRGNHLFNFIYAQYCLESSNRNLQDAGVKPILSHRGDHYQDSCDRLGWLQELDLQVPHSR